MARNRRQNQRLRPSEEVDLDEVDTFDANQEKILLESAGEYAPRGRDEFDDDISEEEVLGNVSDDSDDDKEDSGKDSDEIGSEEDDEDEEDYEERGWGGKKNYYGGDEASDDEDAKQMTEEAMKQQKKYLTELAMDDFVDEDMMEDWKKSEEQEQAHATGATRLIINEGAVDHLDEEDRLKLLHQSFPEFVPLVKELHMLKPRLAGLHSLMESSKGNQLIEVKCVALAAYLAAITSYFAIFVDNLKSGGAFTSMKENSVMETILSSREVWRQANELPEDAEAEIVNVEEYEDDVNEIDIDEVSEEEDSDEEDSDDNENEEFVDAQEHPDELDIDISSKRTIKRVVKKTIGDFTEAATPEDVDAEEKQRRKRTLRFYTSKIDQAAAKNNERYSGDADLPYRERLFERQQRLIEEARKKGLGQDKNLLGADLDDNDFNSDDERLANEINDGEDDAYYQALKEGKQNKKDSRRRAHEEAVKAAKEGKLAEVQESMGEDGKRAINYQILKNKGLTPHRKKEYRNSRVKKRKQYEKAQKKLKSVRQVYDASNRGPYGGEKTGIKKGLSRSVKLV